MDRMDGIYEMDGSQDERRQSTLEKFCFGLPRTRVAAICDVFKRSQIFDYDYESS